MKDNEIYRNFDDMTHIYGRIWGVLAILIILAFPLVLCVYFNVFPVWQSFFKGLIAVLPLFAVVCTIEFITYVPMLGSAGSYLAFVTGNLTNLKVPCALNAMEQAGVKADSEEGELLSTISIAVSSIVTIIIIALGVLLVAMTGFGELLTKPELKASFDNLLPALFGGLGVVFISKNFKVAIAPVILCLVFFIALPEIAAAVSTAFVPISALFAIGVARILYKRGLFDDHKA